MAILVSGCSVSVVPSSVPASPVGGLAAPSDTTVPPPVAGDDPAAGLPYSCGSVPFDIRLFSVPGDAENSGDAAVEGLRRTLAEDPTLPRNGWWQLSRSAGEAEFAARAGDNALWYVRVELTGGAWKTHSWGGCGLGLSVAGFIPVPWQVDPDSPPPGLETRVIHALVTEMCATEPLVARLQPPIVRTTTDAVLVAFVARPAVAGLGPRPVMGTSGGRWSAARNGRTVVVSPLFDHCPGGVSAVVDVDLGEPLGDRALIDGQSWPGRDARLPIP